MVDIENSHFYYVFVSAVYFHETSQSTMRRLAEQINRNSGLPTVGAIALRTLNIAISTVYSYPPYKLKFVRDIIMKFLTNLKHH